METPRNKVESLRCQPTHLPKKYLHFLLVTIVVASSGNPAIMFLGRESLVIALFVGLVAIWLTDPKRPLPQNTLLIIVFLGLVVLQIVIFGSLVFKANMGFILTLFIALLAIRLVPAFWEKYVWILACLSLISLAFQIPIWLGLDLISLLSFFQFPTHSASRVSFLLHTFVFEVDGPIRNSGMFWEPGAFAGYILLALMFLVLTNNAWRLPRWAIWSLVAALLSTLSTTGYIAGMVLGIFWVYNKKGQFKNFDLRMLFIPSALLVAFLIGFFLITQSPFLQEKVSHQWKSSIEQRHGWQITRFGNALYDLEFIKERPLTGWSVTPQTRLIVDDEAAQLLLGQGNGLTGLAVRFGLIGFITYLVAVYSSLSRFTFDRTGRLLGVLIVALLLVGEQFLNFPIFLMLAFAISSQHSLGIIPPTEFVRTKH